MNREGTPIGRVRGLGPAGSGAHHWWLERLTSVSTLVLFAWLLAALLSLPDLSHKTVTDWLAGPLAAVPMLLLIVSTFWHSRLGVQVVIDDYQAGGARVAMTVLNGFFHVALGATAVFAVLKIAFGGDPAA